jgi:hypothetical protein
MNIILVELLYILGHIIKISSSGEVFSGEKVLAIIKSFVSWSSNQNSSYNWEIASI